MFKTILAAVDGSGHADKALRVASEMAAESNSKLILLSVLEPVGLPAEAAMFAHDEHEYVAEVTGRILDQAEAEARKLGVKNIERIDAEGPPTQVILETAKRRDVDLIVMGSRGLSAFTELLIGSVSHKVLQLAACPCLIAR